MRVSWPDCRNDVSTGPTLHDQRQATIIRAQTKRELRNCHERGAQLEMRGPATLRKMPPLTVIGYGRTCTPRPSRAYDCGFNNCWNKAGIENAYRSRKTVHEAGVGRRRPQVGSLPNVYNGNVCLRRRYELTLREFFKMQGWGLFGMKLAEFSLGRFPGEILISAREA